MSDQRKIVYYVGAALMIVGGLLFASVFLTFALRFGDFSNFESNAKSSMFRAVSGMALLFIGRVLRGIGARGLAGSGILLDPDKAREDLKPYSRMAGGMVEDALAEVDLSTGKNQEKVIMVKCRDCGKLNEEDSKFCQECGQKL